MSRPYFDTKMEFRVSNDLVQKMEWIMQNNEEIESTSHLLRCAIMRMYRDIKKKEGDKNEGISNKRGSRSD